MILQEFSKYIQTKNDEIISNKSTAVNLLSEWIQQIMSKNPQTNVEKIIHSELTLAKNKYNEYLIIGKSESGPRSNERFIQLRPELRTLRAC